MKGKLIKIEERWMVGTVCYADLWSNYMPLHLDDESLWMFAELNEEWKDKLDGKEVEFEIVKKVPSEHDVTHGTFVVYKNYAKLISSKEQQQVTEIEDSKDVVETMARDFYWSRQPKGKFMAESSRPDMVIGYVEGYNKAKEDLFTEEQVRKAMFEAYVECENGNNFFNVQDKIIQSLKQPKKD